MAQFVGDGYKDREILAKELVGIGFLWADGGTEGIVAAVLGVLTDLLPKYEGASPAERRVAQMVDLLGIVRDIVQCARDEGLIDDPVG